MLVMRGNRFPDGTYSAKQGNGQSALRDDMRKVQKIL